MVYLKKIRSKVRLIVAHYRMWLTEEKYDTNGALFQSGEYIRNMSKVLGSLKSEDVNSSKLCESNPLWHYSPQELIQCLDLTRLALLDKRKLAIGDASHLKTINAFSYVCGKQDEEEEDSKTHFEQIQESLCGLAAVLEKNQLTRHNERMLKPLCDDLELIANLIIEQR
ncbi:hypothetical protein CZP2022_253 [Vibrio phage C-ZP2022]|nr:hypothetical protein CZP2022_253 [Vibrio phage C-ZP2022]